MALSGAGGGNEGSNLHCDQGRYLVMRARVEGSKVVVRGVLCFEMASRSHVW